MHWDSRVTDFIIKAPFDSLLKFPRKKALPREILQKQNNKGELL